MELRSNQSELMDRLLAVLSVPSVGAEFSPSVLVVAPTGFGKTVCFSYLASLGREARHRILVLVHKRELIRQASAKLTATGVAHGCVAPGWELDPEADVQVASVQTLVRRLDRNWATGFDSILVDEAHHSISPAYLKILAANPGASVIGFTASPERLDGRGLGRKSGGIFDHMIEGPTVRQLQADGFLCHSRVYAPSSGAPNLKGVRTMAGDYSVGQLSVAMSRPKLVGDAVEHYTRHAAGRTALAFCASVAHAELVATAFRDAGYRSVAASGESSTADRDAAMSGLADGRVQVLCTCDLISEGLDVPSVECVILLRPTQSRGLHIQQVGRGLRPNGDKILIALDHAGNTLRHGLPDHEHIWSLEGRPKRAKTTIAVRQCTSCYALHAPAPACPCCGHVYTTAEAKRGTGPQQIAGDLVEVDPAKAAREARVDRWRSILRALPDKRTAIRGAKSYQDLADIATACGHKPGWAWHQAKEMGLKPYKLAVS